MPKKTRTATLETFQHNAGPEGLWYWRLRAPNGRIVADGAEGYTRRADVRRAAVRSQGLMAAAVLEEGGQ